MEMKKTLKGFKITLKMGKTAVDAVFFIAPWLLLYCAGR